MVIQPASAATDRAEDIAAVERLVAALEQAQQRESVADFVGLFAAECVWTTGHGKRLVGRDEVHDFTAAVLPGAMRDSAAQYSVEHILFIGPDVAVVNVRQRPVDLQGNQLPGVPEGRPTYVLVRGDDGWRLAAGQNTLVHEG